VASTGEPEIEQHLRIATDLASWVTLAPDGPTVIAASATLRVPVSATVGVAASRNTDPLFRFGRWATRECREAV